MASKDPPAKPPTARSEPDFSRDLKATVQRAMQRAGAIGAAKDAAEVLRQARGQTGQPASAAPSAARPRSS